MHCFFPAEGFLVPTPSLPRRSELRGRVCSVYTILSPGMVLACEKHSVNIC